MKGPHGHRLAVIEHEFGEVGIDNELLVRGRDEQIIEMNNGRSCCSVRGDLVRILGDLPAKQAAGLLHFDRVVSATTGLAVSAPVAQTFFVDDDISRHNLLDAVVTTVDAKHAIRGFNLGAILEIEPDALNDVAHEHDDDVTSFVFRENRPLDLDRVEDFLGAMVQVYGTKLMRAATGAAWKPGEKRNSKMVFIGRHRPKDLLLEGRALCLAGSKARPQPV